MRLAYKPAVVLMALAMASCRHGVGEFFFGSHDPQVAVEAPLNDAGRLTRAERLVREGKLEEAQDALAPLLGKDFEKERVAELQARINRRLAQERQAGAEDRATLGAIETRERGELRKAAALRLERVRMLERTGRLADAQEVLAPLLDTEQDDSFTQEARKLAVRINQKRTMRAIELAQTETDSRALLEVHGRTVLPAKYGKTVVIDGEDKPLEMPEGPMEKLLNQTVQMRLEEAGVKDLIMALSEIDGMNIIADDALTEEQKLTVNVRDVPLKELLSYIARNMGVAFHLGANMIWVTESLQMQGAGPKLETRIYRLRRGFVPGAVQAAPMTTGTGGGGGGFGGALSLAGGGDGGEDDSELDEAIARFVPQDVEGAEYYIYRHRNLLVVRNTIENLRIVEELIREFDHEPYQVLIEARFITVGQKDLFELGIDIQEFSLEGRDADSRSSIMTFDSRSVFPPFANAASGGNIDITGILGNHTYRAVLHALDKRDNTRTLSAPRITVLNNQSASIRRGDTIRYYQDYDLATIDDQAGQSVVRPVPTGDVTELGVGIALNVRPSVGHDGRTILLSLAPSVSEFKGWEEFETARLPQTNESTLNTKVVVQSGETVVLGGMLILTDQDLVQKVPLLGDIPLLGHLFRHTTKTKEPLHLLIFVTAEVVAKSGEFLDVQLPIEER